MVPAEERDGRIVAPITIEEVGLVRVELQGGGFSPVVENLWIVPPRGANE